MGKTVYFQSLTTLLSAQNVDSKATTQSDPILIILLIIILAFLVLALYAIKKNFTRIGISFTNQNLNVKIEMSKDNEDTDDEAKDINGAVHELDENTLQNIKDDRISK